MGPRRKQRSGSRSNDNDNDNDKKGSPGLVVTAEIDGSSGVVEAEAERRGPDADDHRHRRRSLPEWFHRCKMRRVFEYDTARYPFRELYADWLGVPSLSSPPPGGDNALDRLHTLRSLQESREPVHPKIASAWRSAAMTPKLSMQARASNTFTQKKLYQSEEYNRLVNVYRLFVREVIAPMCRPDCGDTTETGNDDEGDGGGASSSSSRRFDAATVVYQCPPTTRVVLPNGKRTIAMHRDKDYPNHTPAEINFWVPVTTRVWGSNSLWLESQPMRGDFCPVELEYGQCLKFDGYDCRHYTVQNTTDSCRVSFDFRVVSSDLCVRRDRLGDFCVEETLEDGYLAYPHPFWTITRDIEGPLEEEQPQHTPLARLYESLSLQT